MAPIAPAIAKHTLILLGALMLGETTINYIDRQVGSVLAPTLRSEFGWSNRDYAFVTNAFLGTYAIFYSIAGWTMDRLGLRRGLALSVLWWSISIFWTMFLISTAIFFWMFWSVTVHTLPGDYFPPKEVGSVYGIAGTGSTLGSMISTFGAVTLST